MDRWYRLLLLTHCYLFVTFARLRCQLSVLTAPSEPVAILHYVTVQLPACHYVAMTHEGPSEALIILCYTARYPGLDQHCSPVFITILCAIVLVLDKVNIGPVFLIRMNYCVKWSRVEFISFPFHCPSPCHCP